MTVPEKVASFLHKNQGRFYYVDCLCLSIGTTAHAMVTTIRATLVLCNEYTATKNNPACQSSRGKDLIKVE